MNELNKILYIGFHTLKAVIFVFVSMSPIVINIGLVTVTENFWLLLCTLITIPLTGVTTYYINEFDNWLTDKIF